MAGHFRSEKEAAYHALRELEKHLPETPTDDANEWGTMIYRYTDPEGGYWYSYQVPYESKETRHWQPVGIPPKGAEEVAFCHTHPNVTGFSKTDVDTALGISYPIRNTFYMVNKAGAYWYDGTFEKEMFGRSSLIRYGTYWGTPYTTMIKH